SNRCFKVSISSVFSFIYLILRQIYGIYATVPYKYDIIGFLLLICIKRREEKYVWDRFGISIGLLVITVPDKISSMISIVFCFMIEVYLPIVLEHAFLLNSLKTRNSVWNIKSNGMRLKIQYPIWIYSFKRWEFICKNRL
ncbi:hypothetical protein EZS27_040100, partial [termite gut metagenome]